MILFETEDAAILIAEVYDEDNNSRAIKLAKSSKSSNLAI
jgi:hypothetical protein